MRIPSGRGTAPETLDVKRTRHSAEHIVSNLREADAMLTTGWSVAQIVRALGVRE